MKPTKIECLAILLGDGNWCSTSQLIRIGGHRFSAGVHRLRSGAYDGHYWDIERRENGTSYEYRFRGYRTKSPIGKPRCRDCGSSNVSHGGWE